MPHAAKLLSFACSSLRVTRERIAQQEQAWKSASASSSRLTALVLADNPAQHAARYQGRQFPWGFFSATARPCDEQTVETVGEKSGLVAPLASQVGVAFDRFERGKDGIRAALLDYEVVFRAQ